MLRYIFLKLSGFSGKKEFSISSSCNQMLMFRPSTSAKKEFRREGRRIDQTKEQHKRSYSFPSRSRSSRFPDNESLCGGWANSEPSECLGLQPIRRKSFHQNSSTISKETSKRANSVKSEKSQFSTSLTKKKEEEKLDLRSKYHELGCPDSSERYELEVARPRRSKSELIFNVFDYVAKDVDLTDYLQPSNLRPFGSTDNIYLPLLMSQKNLNVVSQSNPNYLQNVTDVDTPERDSSKNIFPTRKTTGNQTNQINKVKKEFTQSKLYDIAKEQESNPVVRENQEVTVSKSSRGDPPASRSTESKPSHRSYDNEQATFQSEASYESDRPVYTKSSVTIEPPPFLPKREDMFSSASFGDISKETKRNIASYKQVQPPWKAYSDHIKSLPKKTLVTYPTGTVMEDIDAVADKPRKPQRKLTLSRSHPVSIEKAKMTDDKPKAFKKQEMIKNNIPQRRTLSMEHVRSSVEPSLSAEDMPKKAKSSTYAQKSLNKNSVTQSLVSLITKGVSLNPSQSYTKSSKVREFEPKPCKSPEKKKRCFLPSKVRLKPPKCITKPTCPKPEPCPPRADDCIHVITKKLPTLKDADCECFEPVIPNQNPKLRRLDLKFVDEPRVCPCVPVECPCPPPPPRADDFAKPQAKKLVTYTPGECPCLEPPPMTDAPLVRLQKICVPEEKCYPKEPCVVETCEDKERADDCLQVCAKQLPSLKMGDCTCFEPRVPCINPKMRRLQLECEDPPRVCPCVEPCVCPETTPVRSDECLEEKIKRLPIMKPKECSCIEPPPMIDVPLKRLKKKCIPEEVCYPKRECPEEKCEDKFRADMCLVEKPKKLPKFNPSDCECFELHVPNQNPKLKRLRMKFVDEPRVCPCEPPVECPCPPPLRADDFAPPKEKKLVPHVAKECACIEPPRMVDVPLVRLQKVCVPEEKCYPKEPCVVETCEDKERADDCLKEKPRKLRPIQPKPCPCVDYKMKEPPRLKRLSLSVPEPPRICPVKVCPPPEEKCARADDCVPQKIKKLPTIKPGECPCIDQRMIDVKPLPRLKCKEDPEECLEEDPCVEFPRADWGCWEYTQDVEGIDDKCRKNKDLNYKQKRKFNTDSRNSINVNSGRSRIMNSINKKNIKSETVNRGLTENAMDAKYINDNVKANLRRKSETPRHKRLQDSNVSTLPRDMKPNTSKTTTLGKPVKDNKKYLGKSASLNRNNSFPTLFLLKELDQMEDTKKIKLKDNKINKLGSILTKITPPPNQVNNCLLGSNVRNLSTVVTNTKKGTSLYPGTAQASSNSNKENKDCDEAKEKPCPSMSKCAQKPMILKNCPPKEDRTCEKLRPPVCCEKKQVPSPAFSECMDDEIQPFSNTSQWTCNRRQYGFEPNPKKANEPLDTVRSKKKFSTSTTHNQNADNSVVNYFSVRYPKSEVRLSSNRGGQVFDRIIKSSSGCRDTTQRDSSTLTDTTSDITECKSVKKNFASVEERRQKLLNQKSNYTVAGVSCRKMSTQNKGHALLRPDNFDLPYSRPSVSQSILRRDMSMLNNKYSNYTDGVTEDLTDDSLPLTQPSHRPYSSDKGNNQRSNCKFPKKKKGCPKFEMDNCPEKERHTCTVEYRQRDCQRLPAPYPSFSELMDDEIEDKLTECPIAKERVEELQPRYTNRFVTRKPLPPILPAQGRIDPKIEERCIRERLCMQNEGLTQDCENFGQYVKPLKSKHFFKERNRDCEKIEELKKLGKWPPKSMREFSTYVSTAFDHQKRNMCSSAHVGKINRNEHQRESDRGTENNIVLTKSENTSVRSYHALCKIPRNKATGKVSKKTCQNRFMEVNESCKCTGLRKVPRRIDNFQKWYKFKKMRYHTCSKLKYRRFIRRRRNTKPFTTCVAKTRVANLNVKGVICSKLKYKKIEKNRQNPKHLSISSAKTRIETNDSNQRGISTTNILAKNNKQKLIRFPLYPKPIKKSTTLKIPNCPEKLKKIAHNVKNNEANVRSWQPKYSSVPEVDTVSIPSYQSKTESGWGKDCLIQLTGKEKKGKTWDCSAVEKPFIRLNSANLVDDCAKQDSMPCIPCGEVFMRNNQVHMKATERRNQPTKCPKLPNPCEGQKKHSKRSKPSRPVCPSESKRSECKPSPCTPPMLSLWEKIVNYFKAKPNCPAPDEWKKKALREKAEKAAKAAGLCLCEPQDLPQNVSERAIEKQSTNGSKINSSDDCISTRKGPYRTTTRHYSSGVNSWDGEELEEEKKKQLAKKLSQVLLEETNYEDDVSQRCPDPLLESVFKEAIMHRNSLRCLEKSTDFESKDEYVNYALNIIPSDINFLADCIKEPSSEGTKFEQSQQISDIGEYFSTIDSMTEITFEELEKAKTKNLVKELDKLLKENQKSHKKN